MVVGNEAAADAVLHSLSEGLQASYIEHDLLDTLHQEDLASPILVVLRNCLGDVGDSSCANRWYALFVLDRFNL